MSRAPDLAVPRLAFWGLVLAKVVGGWGLTWDIDWHVKIGRDTFWIAPHLMIYGSVVAGLLLGFGVLARDTWRARAGHAVPGPRVLGVHGSRGFHLSAWGLAVVVLAAPIDDLWHRLFGLDVTLWSPPHLLGLVGSAVNSLGCLVIAVEVYPAARWRRLAGVALAGALLYGGLRVMLDPTWLIAFTRGGVAFHGYAMLAALVLPLALLPAARLAGRRWMPVLVLAVALALGVSGQRVAALGFAVLQPASVLDEEIRKDPTSPIALANAIGARNRGVPIPWTSRLLLPLLPVAAMALVDPRRRPLAATLAWAVTFFAVNAWTVSARPAFAPLVPGAPETALALAITLAAALVGALAARRLADRLVAPAPPTAVAAVPQPA